MTPRNHENGGWRRTLLQHGPEEQRTNAVFRSSSMGHDAPTIHYQRDTSLSSSPFASPRSTIQKSNSDPIPFTKYITQDSDSSSCRCWVWKIQLLLPIPMFHLDEWNDLTVDHLPLDKITTRISEFMRLASIQCDYDNDHGKVTCRTNSSLHFVVQLWQSARGATVILVQIQKVQGCSFEFQEIRQDLSNAILSGQRAMPPNTGQQQLPTSWICNDFLSNAIKRLPIPFDGSSSYSCEDRHGGGGRATRSASLDLSWQLLKSNFASETRLGLESLAVLTDPSKTMREDVDSASRAVLLCDSDIQRLLTNYFILPLEASSQDDMAIDDDDEEYHRRMHMIALRIISNSLEWVATTPRHHQHEQQGSSSSVDLSSSASSPFWQRVWQSISYNLRLASQRPQEAILSIRCLRFLMLLQTTRALLDEEGSRQQEQENWWTDRCLTDWLLDANRYGKQYNLSLEQETKKLLAQV